MSKKGHREEASLRASLSPLHNILVNLGNRTGEGSYIGRGCTVNKVK